MLTINDIAKRAGVAKSTVSRFLNGGSISEKTRIKIKEIIEETGYAPNVFAQSLKAKKTGLIGVIIPRLASAATNSVLKGMDDVAYQHGQRIMIVNTDQDTARELEAMKVLAKQKVDYIIWLARSYTVEHDELIKKLKTPIIIIGQSVPNLPTISYDDYHAGELIAEHIVELHHKHVLYIGVTPEDQAVGSLRKQGVFDYLGKFSDITVDYIESGFDFDAAYQLALQILPNVKASYIIAATDTIALAVLKASYECRKQVPKEIALSGFGGYDGTGAVFPAITTVRYPYEEAGRLVMKKIHEKTELTEHIILPVELLVKQSTQSLN